MKKREENLGLRIFPESCGLRLVQKNGKYYFIDKEGKRSGADEFDLATPYTSDGFSHVAVDADDAFCWRDLLGNYSPEKTYLGKRVCLYIKRAINLDELLCDNKLPYDEKLVDFIVKNEELKMPKPFSKSKYEREIKRLHESIYPLIEGYILAHDTFSDDEQSALLKR